MTIERNEERVEKKLLVNIDKEGLETMGITCDISTSGMSLATSEILPLNCQVSLQIGIADETFNLKGEVMWSKEQEGAGDANISTGIKLIDAPEKYVQYVKEMIAAN